MGEVLVPLFVLGSMFVAVLLAIGAVLGWRTWSRTKELERRLKQVERDLRELRASSEPPAAARAGATAPTPPAPSPSVIAPPAAVAPSPIPSSAERVEAPAQPPPLPISSATQAPPKAPKPAEVPRAGAAGSAARDLPAPVRAVKVEWERWLGVRGAAVLGGVFLIVAGFLFLQYSIERNWVTKEVRLIAGTIAGATCLVAAHFLRKRQYVVLSNSLSGAGIVLLYAVAWAAHRLYGVIEFPAAFAAMVVVTVLCAALSYRHASQLISTLGLLGGFATPLVLSTGADHPIGLFGYALLLDMGFLFVAHRHRWPAIGLLALAGSIVIQGIWFVLRMGKDELTIGIGALLVFGLLFAIFSALQPAAERRRWVPAQIAALIFPFCFAIYFSQHVDFGFHLAPLAAVAAVMTIAGGVMARLQKTAALSIGTASAALALVLVWTLQHARELADARASELVICALGLAAIQVCFAEWERRKRPSERTAAGAAAIACLGFLLACAYACPQADSVPLTTWIAALVLLPLALLRLHSFGVHWITVLLGALASGASIAIWVVTSSVSVAGAPRHPGTLALAGILLAIGLTFLAAARLVRSEFRRSAFFAVAVFFPMALIALCQRPPIEAARVDAFAAAVFALGLAMALAANGARSSFLFGAAAVCTFWAFGSDEAGLIDAQAGASGWSTLVASVAGGVALFALWPLFAPKSMAERAGAWRVAAAAPLLWFPLLHGLWAERLAGKFGFAPALAFAVVLGACALLLWRRGTPEADAKVREAVSDAPQKTLLRTQSIARAWFGAFALLYACLALPLHLDARLDDPDRHTLCVAAALYTFALSVWWRKSDHRGLKYVAAAIALAVTIDLFGAAVSDRHAGASRRVFNARGYWLLMPAVAMLLGSIALVGREIPRLRGFESRTSPKHLAPATATLAACGVLLFFCFVNLEVADAFSTSPTFRWTLHGEQRANLAQSIAWALFALALLVLGVSRRIGALRWASLFLFLITIAKVFLLDLAHLGGLYRVASILGLALSLLLVSFLYQRFVFRPVKAAP